MREGYGVRGWLIAMELCEMRQAWVVQTYCCVITLAYDPRELAIHAL